MEILLPVLLFALGTIFIIKGGDMFVDAAGWMSDVTGISKVVIGATVVSFATTSPEYFVSTIAILKGYNDLSIGNAVGSLICNLGIGYAVICFFIPGKITDSLFGLKALIMLASVTALWFFCLNGSVSVPEAVYLLLIYILFTFINIRYSKGSPKEIIRRPADTPDIVKNVFKFIGGAAAIVFGSNLIVDNGQAIALHLGISEAVIGLTVVAIGTSLPELVTAIASIIKKESSLSIGNIIGANTLDATLILATGTFLSGGGLSVSRETIIVDLPVAVLFTVIVILPTLVGRKIYKWQGLSLLALYTLYLAYLTAYSSL